MTTHLCLGGFGGVTHVMPFSTLGGLQTGGAGGGVGVGGGGVGGVGGVGGTGVGGGGVCTHVSVALIVTLKFTSADEVNTTVTTVPCGGTTGNGVWMVPELPVVETLMICPVDHVSVTVAGDVGNSV